MARLPSVDSLCVFAVAARHLSFTAAAAEPHRTQSAVNHRVKALEAEIGTRLFERSARGLELTAAGRALCSEARATAAVAAEMEVEETQLRGAINLPVVSAFSN